MSKPITIKGDFQVTLTAQADYEIFLQRKNIQCLKDSAGNEIYAFAALKDDTAYTAGPPRVEVKGQEELNDLKRKVAQLERQSFDAIHENKVNLSRSTGEGIGNFAPFTLSGPSKQDVTRMFKVDTGALCHTDLFVTPELAAELGLGAPQVYEKGVRGAERRPIACVDYPIKVRVVFRLPNGIEKKALLSASSMLAEKSQVGDKVRPSPDNMILCIDGQHKLGIKLDLEHYYIYEISEAEAAEYDNV